MSATPLETASNTSKALTSCPAPKTWTLTRPPVIAVIARPSLSALLPRPGRPFGQLVTILSSRAPCAMAGAGNVAATPATAPAWVKKLRRSMARFLGFFCVSGRQPCEPPGHQKFSQIGRWPAPRRPAETRALRLTQNPARVEDTPAWHQRQPFCSKRKYSNRPLPPAHMPLRGVVGASIEAALP